MKRDFERVTVADGVRDSLLSVILPESAVMRELSKLVDSPRVKVISWNVTVGEGFGEEEVTEKIVFTSAMVESNLVWGEGRVSSDSIFGPIVSDCVMAVAFVSAACLLSPLFTRMADVVDGAMCEYPTEIVLHGSSSHPQPSKSTPAVSAATKSSVPVVALGGKR